MTTRRHQPPPVFEAGGYELWFTFQSLACAISPAEQQALLLAQACRLPCTIQTQSYCILSDRFVFQDISGVVSKRVPPPTEKVWCTSCEWIARNPLICCALDARLERAPRPTTVTYTPVNSRTDAPDSCLWLFTCWDVTYPCWMQSQWVTGLARTRDRGRSAAFPRRLHPTWEPA